MKLLHPVHAILFYVTLVMTAATVVCCAHPDRDTLLSTHRGVQQQYDTVVEIVTTCDDMHIMMGSGVLVSTYQALTADHVVDCGKTKPSSVKLVTIDGAEYLMHVEVTDVPEDLVRLGTTGFPFTAASVVIGAKPSLGDTICIVAVVPRLGRRCGEVQPSYISGPSDLKHNIITEHGNSGGPAYDAHGALIGLVDTYWACSNGQICGGGVTSLADRRWILP